MRIQLEAPINCPDCHATGLFQGFFERHEEACICRTCGGDGSVDYIDVDATPFTAKQPPTENIKWVYPTGRDGNAGVQKISIEEYLAGKGFK